MLLNAERLCLNDCGTAYFSFAGRVGPGLCLKKMMSAKGPPCVAHASQRSAQLQVESLSKAEANNTGILQQQLEVR
jgi:hypothetical protein